MIHASIRRSTLMIGALLGTALMTGALAQQFPSKPVRIVVSYPPGGPVDALARPLADGLQKLWNGNPVLVENRPGANAIIGTDYVAKQPGDGHTLLLANDPSLSSNQYLFSKLPYDPVKDFVPVVGVASTTLILLVPPSRTYATFPQLVAAAKDKPGTLSYGSIGPGSVTHLDAEAMASAAAVKLVHVPYKGTGEVVPALLAGQIDMALSAIGPSLGHIRSGKLRVLAIASNQRNPLLPDVPTFNEAGLPNFEARSWFALAAPAGTPRAVVDKIAADVRKIVDTAEYRDKYIVGMGLDPLPLGPDAFAKYLDADRAKYAQRVKNANVRLD
ncbi:MAG: Bug family tripartite tricarboxylate transporter substrate binding protein [Burkholderiales bacterium]